MDRENIDELTKEALNKIRSAEARSVEEIADVKNDVRVDSLKEEENYGEYVFDLTETRESPKEDYELDSEGDRPAVRVEICDLYELAYDVEDLDCDYLIIPLRLLNEVTSKLSPKGLKLFFKLYHNTWEEWNYCFDVDEEAVRELVDKGYLEMRADGKYIFYLSAFDYKLESMGERLGKEDWDVDHSCVSDL